MSTAHPLPLRLTDYTRWTASMWVGHSGQDPRDIGVMGLGLAGESGEVAAALLTTPRDPEDVLKELGDVLYYWGRICEAFSIAVATVWSDPADLELPAETELFCAAAAVAEVLKKRLRGDAASLSDEFNHRLTAALRRVSRAWHSLVLREGLTVDQVISASMEKLMSRKSRSTLQGDGDNR